MTVHNNTNIIIENKLSTSYIIAFPVLLKMRSFKLNLFFFCFPLPKKQINAASKLPYLLSEEDSEFCPSGTENRFFLSRITALA